tara:strand:+ start:164 stop:634 length:471 start_codon:yes stop_codon:yes gene_type:complete
MSQLPLKGVPPIFQPYQQPDKRNTIYKKGQRVEFWNRDNCPDVAGLQPGHPCMNLVTGVIQKRELDKDLGPGSGTFYQILMETDGGSGTLINGVHPTYITKIIDNWDGELLVNKPTPTTTKTTTTTQTAGMGGTNIVMLLVVGGFLFYAYNKGLLK